MIPTHDLHLIDAGWYGVEVITDTAAHLGQFDVLRVLTTASATIVAAGILSGNAFTTVSLPAGAVVRIPRMTSITLASGAVLAYKSPPTVLH